MLSRNLKRYGLIWLLAMISTTSFAHDPVFGIGPHVLYKEGIEITLFNYP